MSIPTEQRDAAATPLHPQGATPAATAMTPLVIQATGGWRALDLREAWRFRDLFRALVVRDVKLRYRQTLLGISWVVLQPLLSAGVLTLVFGTVAKLPSAGVPYFLLTLSGTVTWSLFSNYILRGSGSLVANSALVSKVFFPRVLLPLSTAGQVLVDVLVSLVLVVGAAAIEGIYPAWALLTLPLWLAATVILATGPVLILSAATVSFRDVAYVLPVLVQLGLYASPVAYDISAIPVHLRRWYEANPLVAPIDGARWALLGTPAPSALSILSTCVAIAVMIPFGAVFFRKFEQRFADVI